ncbi:hypothetical protein AX17_003074 [Amanita inopinata Kibby_2008]|nr:hypothetical protein AX17_003074 [Amanita inopinata Kibby_2008]
MSSSTLVCYIIKKVLKHGQHFCVYPSAFFDGPRCPYAPEDYGIPYENVELITSDGVTLRCYLLKADFVRLKQQRHSCCIPLMSCMIKVRKVRATVIMFLGNGMEIGGFAELNIGRKYHNLHCNVLMVSYRGYGLSEGTPSEKGLRRDAQAALDYVLSQPNLSSHPVIVYGLSLGGAVAIDLTSRNPSKISGLIVENTFTSLPDVVHGWPLIGIFSFLCHQRWNSAAKITHIPSSLPILMLSGRRDEVVPPQHMNKLHQLALTRKLPPPKSKEKGDPQPQQQQQQQQQGEGEGEEMDPSEFTVFEAFPRGHHASTNERSGYTTVVRKFLDRQDVQGQSKKGDALSTPESDMPPNMHLD